MSDVEQVSELYKAVRALGHSLLDAGAVDFGRLDEFHAVNRVATFGWATNPTLHEAVHRFSETLVQSWYRKTGGQFGTPDGPREVIQRLAKLAIPNPIEVEAELSNEYRETCRNSDGVDDYGKIHSAIVQFACLASVCWSLAQNADKTRDDTETVGEKKAQAIDPKAKRLNDNPYPDVYDSQNDDAASKGSKRTILLVLWAEDSINWKTRKNAGDIARKTQKYGGEIKDQTVRVHARWLRTNKYIDVSREAGNSGYWLTKEGKKLARKLAKL